MSEPSPSAPGKAGPPKKQVSPARNAIGLIALLAVVVIGYFEVSAKMGYNAATNALNERLKDEEHGLPTVPETEKLIGKAPDDAGSEFQDGSFRYTKKTYTWKGLFTTYTLAAYYTAGSAPALHHIEAGEKYEAQPAAAQAPPPAQSGAQQPKGKGSGRAKAEGKSKAGAAETKAPEPEEKAQAPADATTKAAADEKKAPEPKPEDKTKAAADEKKAPEPKPEDKAKAAPDEKTKTD